MSFAKVDYRTIGAPETQGDHIYNSLIRAWAIASAQGDAATVLSRLTWDPANTEISDAWRETSYAYDSCADRLWDALHDLKDHAEPDTPQTAQWAWGIDG